MLRTRIIHLLLWLRNTVLDAYYWLLSRREFMDRLSRVHTTGDSVDLIFQYKGGGFYKWLKPNQDETEIKTLGERVHSIAPKVIVEIGTRGGGTLLLWSQSSEQLELLVSIDLTGGIHGGGYPDARAKLYLLFTA